MTSLDTGFNEFGRVFRNYITDDLDVYKKIKDRVYSVELASLTDPVFPLVTITVLPGRDIVTIIQNFTIQIQVWSENHYWEAHQVFELIRERIKSAVINPGIIVNSRETPLESYDDTSNLYRVSGRFRVHWVRPSSS